MQFFFTEDVLFNFAAILNSCRCRSLISDTHTAQNKTHGNVGYAKMIMINIVYGLL